MAHKSSRNLLRLVESPAAPVTFEQRHWDHHQRLWEFDLRQSLPHKLSQKGRDWMNALILQKMDQVPQRSVIGAESNGPVKWGRGPAAKPAYRAFAGIHKLAEELLAADAAQNTLQRNNLVQATLTDRQGGNSSQRSLADSAIGGKQHSKQAFGCGPKCLLSPVWVTATAEDDPPNDSGVAGLSISLLLPDKQSIHRDIGASGH